MRGADNAEHALWAFERSGEPWVLALVELLRVQITDWTAKLQHGPMARQPWTTASAKVRLRTDAARVRGWDLVSGSAGPIPAAPERASAPEPVRRVPFGCARLRVTCLPVVSG
jgi:hypothetical protein